MAEPVNGANPVSVGAATAPKPESDTLSPGAVFSEPPPYFTDALEDAERLMKYAAETGIAVDQATRDHVLQARMASNSGAWTEEIAANLMAALTTLSELAKPVTAESLKISADDHLPTVRNYLIIAICLAIFIVPFSVASFLASAIANNIRADIALANDLAVKLQSQLGYPQQESQPAGFTSGPCTPFPPAQPANPPANISYNEVVTALQQYASAIRSIDARTRQLATLIPNREPDPCYAIRRDPAKIHQVFQLPSGLPNLAQAAQDRTTLYQDIRYFAQNVLDDESFFYGAVASCILPVLYALLGTCAYLLRSFEQQMSSRTFVPSEVNSARFLIAAIGGAVVGLFNNFNITQGASLSPLALAFLIGYAVDVFFAFLEGLLQMFTRNITPAPAAVKAKAASE